MSELTASETLRLHGLHCVARVTLRVRSLLQAKELLDRMGSLLPPLRGAEAAMSAVQALFPSGSCLSRAVTIAATVPGAEVVIGINAWTGARIEAHAWLEIDGVRVDTRPGDAPFPDELARLPARHSSSTFS